MLATIFILACVLLVQGKQCPFSPKWTTTQQDCQITDHVFTTWFMGNGTTRPGQLTPMYGYLRKHGQKCICAADAWLQTFFHLDCPPEVRKHDPNYFVANTLAGADPCGTKDSVFSVWVNNSFFYEGNGDWLVSRIQPSLPGNCYNYTQQLVESGFLPVETPVVPRGKLRNGQPSVTSAYDESTNLLVSWIFGGIFGRSGMFSFNTNTGVLMNMTENKGNGLRCGGTGPDGKIYGIGASPLQPGYSFYKLHTQPNGYSSTTIKSYGQWNYTYDFFATCTTTKSDYVFLHGEGGITTPPYDMVSINFETGDYKVVTLQSPSSVKQAQLLSFHWDPMMQHFISVAQVGTSGAVSTHLISFDSEGAGTDLGAISLHGIAIGYHDSAFSTVSGYLYVQMAEQQVYAIIDTRKVAVVQPGQFIGCGGWQMLAI